MIWLGNFWYFETGCWGEVVAYMYMYERWSPGSTVFQLPNNSTAQKQVSSSFTEKRDTCLSPIFWDHCVPRLSLESPFSYVLIVTLTVSLSQILRIFESEDNTTSSLSWKAILLIGKPYLWSFTNKGFVERRSYSRTWWKTWSILFEEYY